IHGAIWCDQSTVFDSSSCSRKLPAVWKSFVGMIGACSCASASGVRSGVSSAPPRSNHSRIVGTSRRTISSPSTRPTLPLSYVTSFIRGQTLAADTLRDERIRLRRANEPFDLEVLAELDVHQPGGRPVVQRRDAVPRQRRG